jgi:hypothetical protein
MVSRDTTVYIFKDGCIIIENSLCGNGKLSTFSVVETRDVLRQIMAFGDTVPDGVFDELDKI